MAELEAELQRTRSVAERLPGVEERLESTRRALEAAEQVTAGVEELRQQLEAAERRSAAAEQTTLRPRGERDEQRVGHAQSSERANRVEPLEAEREEAQR